MKNILPVVLLAVIVFLAHHHGEKERALANIETADQRRQLTLREKELAQQVEDIRREAAQLRHDAQRLASEREAAGHELSLIKADIARAPATPAKSQNWIDQRLENAKGRLDSPSRPSPTPSGLR
jgi:predicted  nucleic acid-binding Zn-ribbon protein